MKKPKKPLRRLFASTEAPLDVPSKKPPMTVPTSKKEAPKGPAKSKLPLERLAPPPRVKPQPAVLIMDAPESILERPTTTTAECAPIERNRIDAIQYNFEAMKDIRKEWQEIDYVQFLRRLENLQTEAFLLRGKLLAEAKQRFFETNKQGWASFCDVELGLNYTTANQYIRVATEFDVTSHQRPDFGFEHFKALLPLTLEDRSLILDTSEGWSVKAIRNKVREIVTMKTKSSSNSSVQSARETSRRAMRLMRTLVALKTETSEFADAFENLNAAQRMQVAATCHSAAAHLLKLARILNDEPEVETTSRPLQSRAGAFATAEGFSALQDVLAVTSTPDHATPK